MRPEPSGDEGREAGPERSGEASPGAAQYAIADAGAGAVPEASLDGGYATVVEFDLHRGLGTLVADDGRRLGFHCTAMADGSRRIDPGTEVVFEVTAGRLGRWEATAIRPLERPTKPERQEE